MPSKRRGRMKQEARRRPFRTPKRRLLVVCEGEITEPQYFRGLERFLRDATLSIEIPPERGEPKNLVEVAKKFNSAAVQDAWRSGDDNLRFDEVWCVFDRDDHERFNTACQMARDNLFKLAVSNPSFELWLLLHFQDNPGAQHRDRIEQMLRGKIHDYDKAVDFKMFNAGLNDAGARAKRIGDHAREDGENLYANPSTSVFLLVASMLKELKGKEPYKEWVWLQESLAELEE
jgi:hypothetical protein